MSEQWEGTPASLEGWTLETVFILLRTHWYEAGWFDYKEVLTSKGDPSHTANLRKTAAAMANGEGGYLVFGVKDAAAAKGLAPEERIVGIPLDADLQKQVQDKFDLITPSISFACIPKPILIPDRENRGIYIVSIPRSALRPHMVDRQFWKRGEGGAAVAMDYYEIRDQMRLTDERLRRVTLLRTLLRTFRAQHTRMRDRGVNLTLDRFDTSLYSSLVADVFGVIPAQSAVEAPLLQIAVTTAQINVILDRCQLHGAGQHWASENFWAATNELVQALLDAESQLEKIFGPL